MLGPKSRQQQLKRRKGLLTGSSSSKPLPSQQATVEEKRLESKLEWEELFDHEEMRKRRREAAANVEAVDYDDVVAMDGEGDDVGLGAPFSGVKKPASRGAESDSDDSRGSGESDAGAAIGKKLKKQKVVRLGDEDDDGGGAESGASGNKHVPAGKEPAADEHQAENAKKTTSTGKKKLGIRGGNKETKKAKKARKKEEKRAAAEERRGKKEEDPDRFKRLLVQGESKMQRIDTRRLCTYIDRDAPDDLRKMFGGDFRSAAERQDEEKAAASVAARGAVMDYDDLD